MALRITKTDNVFELQGRLCSSQVHEVRNFFNSKLQDDDELNISLCNLDDLDLSGVMMLERLREEAFKTRKSIQVFSGENKKILAPFRMLEQQLTIPA
jgi:ABC-type transporter Mla MlaB component